jgi:hypothetical protein
MDGGVDRVQAEMEQLTWKQCLFSNYLTQTLSFLRIGGAQCVAELLSTRAIELLVPLGQWSTRERRDVCKQQKKFRVVSRNNDGDRVGENRYTLTVKRSRGLLFRGRSVLVADDVGLTA